MQIIEEAATILSRNRYLVSEAGNASLRLEDDSLVGFLFVKENVTEIISGWNTTQTAVIRDHAAMLRVAPLKAWNLYLIFLTAAAPNPDEKRALGSIEEDFRSARKIAQGNILTTSGLIRALYPLLPIQNATFALEKNDARSRLEAQLKDLPREAVKMAIDGSEDISARRFLEIHGYKGH
ncbi:MAG TPA: hypothetical protein VNW97_19465 [Candidatus Saccharimonadales bacterium]|jgi:hypothetical protein|nr:hypothetical protein [Candidatus Saccharimonadales bacterium]